METNFEIDYSNAGAAAENQIVVVMGLYEKEKSMMSNEDEIRFTEMKEIIKRIKILNEAIAQSQVIVAGIAVGLSIDEIGVIEAARYDLKQQALAIHSQLTS